MDCIISSFEIDSALAIGEIARPPARQLEAGDAIRRNTEKAVLQEEEEEEFVARKNNQKD